MNKDEQDLNAEGYTSSLRPEVTNGANEYMKGKVVDTMKDNETGKMYAEGDMDMYKDDEAEPNDSEELSPNEEADTASFGDPQ